jgi:hypothetical protein
MTDRAADDVRSLVRGQYASVATREGASCCTIDTDARGHVVDFKRRRDGVVPDGCCGDNACR